MGNNQNTIDERLELARTQLVELNTEIEEQISRLRGSLYQGLQKINDTLDFAIIETRDEGAQAVSIGDEVRAGIKTDDADYGVDYWEVVCIDKNCHDVVVELTVDELPDSREIRIQLSEDEILGVRRKQAK